MSRCNLFSTSQTIPTDVLNCQLRDRRYRDPADGFCFMFDSRDGCCAVLFESAVDCIEFYPSGKLRSSLDRYGASLRMSIVAVADEFTCLEGTEGTPFFTLSHSNYCYIDFSAPMDHSHPYHSHPYQSHPCQCATPIFFHICSHHIICSHDN